MRAICDDEIVDAERWAADNKLNLFILGGGSNVLIADAGFDGVVLQIAVTGIKMLDVESGTHQTQLIEVGAGEDWDSFVKYCTENNLAGVECLSGIPGFVGGTPIQNVGAYGQEVAETIVSVRCFDRASNEMITLTNEECGFSYRKSIFNSTHPDRFIVLGVTFRLSRGGRPKVVYKDLIEHFGGRGPSLQDIRDAVLRIRCTKSMVVDPTDPNSKSAGSFFKNPIVSTEKLTDLRMSFDRIPSFRYGNKFKIPAAWLIETVGFKKGFVLGDVGISANHSLALINRGNASAADVLVLKNRIQEAVAEQYGIELYPEPIFIGF